MSGSVVRVRVGFGPAAVRMTPWIDRAGLLFTSRSVHPMIWQVSSDPDWLGRLLLTRVLRMAGPGRAATGSPACAAAASVDVCLPPPYTGSAFGVRRVPLRAATAPGKDTPKGTGSTVQALCHNGNALTPGRIGNVGHGRKPPRQGIGGPHFLESWVDGTACRLRSACDPGTNGSRTTVIQVQWTNGRPLTRPSHRGRI